MATAARSSTAPAASSALVSVEHVLDLIAANAALERELKSSRARARTMFRALNEQSGRTLAAVGVFGRGQTVERVVRAAQIAESLGEVPAIRFLRDERGDINGVEIALLERAEPAAAGEEYEAGFRLLAQMAVSAGGES